MQGTQSITQSLNKSPTLHEEQVLMSLHDHCNGQILNNYSKRHTVSPDPPDAAADEKLRLLLAEIRPTHIL